MKKILLVDDDPLLQTMYKDLLTLEGYSVDVAGTPELGLNKLLSTNWDLVLMDMILPQETGLNVVKKALQESSSLKTTKIIFLTNLDDPTIISEIQQLGYTYLMKSKMNPDKFLEIINKYLL